MLKELQKNREVARAAFEVWLLATRALTFSRAAARAATGDCGKRVHFGNFFENYVPRPFLKARVVKRNVANNSQKEIPKRTRFPQWAVVKCGYPLPSEDY